MTATNPVRAPRHPGRILIEDFLARIPALTQAEVADGLGMSRPRLNELLNGVRGVSPDTALRLARGFGTTAEFWMSAQSDWDLLEARRSRKKMREIEQIRPWLEPAVKGGIDNPVDLSAVGVAEPTVSSATVEHYEDFLARKGMLTEARRFVRIRGEIRNGESRKVAEGMESATDTSEAPTPTVR